MVNFDFYYRNLEDNLEKLILPCCQINRYKCQTLIDSYKTTIQNKKRVTTHEISGCSSRL